MVVVKAVVVGDTADTETATMEHHQLLTFPVTENMCLSMGNFPFNNFAFFSRLFFCSTMPLGGNYYGPPGENSSLPTFF